MEEQAEEALTKNGRCLQDEEWKAIRRGWRLGGKEYRRRLLKILDELITDTSREAYAGEAMREHGERDAEVLIGEGLKKLGLMESELEDLPKRIRSRVFQLGMLAQRRVFLNIGLVSGWIWGRAGPCQMRSGKSGEKI